MDTTMTAWIGEAYGPASGTHRTELPVPVPRRDEVLLRVRATSLNAGDVRLMLGDPLLVRPVFGMRRPKFPVRGMDVAGTVVAIGSEVVGVVVGQEVVGELQGGGGLAPYAVIAASRLVSRPSDVPPQFAACVPVAGGTAWQALDLARIGLGGAGHDGGAVPRVLIIGASGGVGTFAVQLAALRGAEVWATCGVRNAPLVDRLGAVRTLDHRTTPLSTLPAAHFDAVIDIAGGMPLRQLQRLVAPEGTAVLVTGDGGHVLGPVPRMLKAAVLSIGSRRRIRPLAASTRPGVLRELLDLVGTGRVVPVIEREYPFDRASSALARLELGHTVGKLVVAAADPAK